MGICVMKYARNTVRRVEFMPPFDILSLYIYLLVLDDENFSLRTVGRSNS